MSKGQEVLDFNLYLDPKYDVWRGQITDDPLTRCPVAGCNSDHEIARCCGHYVGGNYPDEPPSCCTSPDIFVCDWCAENDKRTATPSQGKES